MNQEIPHIRVLLVEYSQADARMVVEALRDQSLARFELTHVVRLGEAVELLGRQSFDVALLDFSLPDALGLEIVQNVTAAAPQMPVLVFTGNASDELALRALQQGAQEYLVKSRVDDYLLVRAIRYAIERKRSDVERLQALARAEAAVRARDSILGVVSHDLRSPLNVIALGAAILHQNSLPREIKVRHIETIQRSVRQMDRLVQDLLDVAKIEAGQLHIAPQRVEVGVLLADIVATCGALAEQSGLAFLAPGEAPACAVHGDRDRLLQVFANLIGNAIKFTPSGGRIEIGVEEVADVIQFHVRDTGPGIPDEHLDHLFDLYWQADRASRQGAGLGLFITQSILHGHGGKIWVKSELGAGTTFYFTVPREPGALAD